MIPIKDSSEDISRIGVRNDIGFFKTENSTKVIPIYKFFQVNFGNFCDGASRIFKKRNLKDIKVIFNYQPILYLENF